MFMKEIMYLIPYQNAAFYLAHEFGHQLGLVHQVDTPCYTNSYMSVMTKSHTVSYEQARWSQCENKWINNNICQFECLFNKPDNYEPIKNKYATLPGQLMNNDQQAKMIEPNKNSLGEVSSFTFMPSDVTSRCLYFRYYIGESNGGKFVLLNKFGYDLVYRRRVIFSENKYAFSPMLPGSECGENSICYLDKCVSNSDLDSSLLIKDYDIETLNLHAHCTSGHKPEDLTASNHDPHHRIQCIDWENDFLCQKSQKCPTDGASSTVDLYRKHICCATCSKDINSVVDTFNRARLNQTRSTFTFIIIITTIIIGFFLVT
ncbi:unnamed protein product [Rotaria socialis]|uniref:Peptidase M12B domain-containing protein n=2 Tax=Rotaria socialis TaxID=392032 RepID=A0A820YMQ8_9BILA|nr:unnamed protein product [Rotaria socialis]